VDDLTVKVDRDENGSFETVEHVDNFTQDADGFTALTDSDGDDDALFCARIGVRAFSIVVRRVVAHRRAF